MPRDWQALSNMPKSFKWGCWGKKRRKRDTAIKWAKNEGYPAIPYFCTHCMGWHIGHRKKSLWFTSPEQHITLQDQIKAAIEQMGKQESDNQVNEGV
jgi:hypothetical protein